MYVTSTPYGVRRWGLFRTRAGRKPLLQSGPTHNTNEIGQANYYIGLALPRSTWRQLNFLTLLLSSFSHVEKHPPVSL
jgi:hypothetical protein